MLCGIKPSPQYIYVYIYIFMVQPTEPYGNPISAYLCIHEHEILIWKIFKYPNYKTVTQDALKLIKLIKVELLWLSASAIKQAHLSELQLIEMMSHDQLKKKKILLLFFVLYSPLKCQLQLMEEMKLTQYR